MSGITLTTEWPGATFIYVIAATRAAQFTAPVKVGISNDPLRRLAQLNSTACPYILDIFSTFRFPSRAVAARLEYIFHRIHREDRTAREWFNLEPTAAVESLSYALMFDLARTGGQLHHAQAIASWASPTKIIIDPVAYEEAKRVTQCK